MNFIQKLTKNILFLSSSKFFLAIFSFVLSIYVARLYGDFGLGQLSFSMTFPNFFLVFLDFGYETLLVREVARNKNSANEYLSNIFGFKLLLIPLTFGLIVFLINIMGYPSDTINLVYLFSFYFIFLSLSALFRVTFRAFERMEFEAVIMIFAALIRVSLSITALYFGYGLFEVGLIFVFSGFLEFIISYVVCSKKFVKPKINLDFNFIKNTIRIAFPLAVLSIFGLIFIKVDTIMLSYMRGNDVVGWYNAAYNLTLSLKSIPILVMNALLPILSNFYISSKKSLEMSYEKTFKYLFYIGLPIAVGIFMLADKFIFFFYGSGFSNSIIALKILAWDVPIKFLYICSSYILIATNKQRQMAIILVLTATLNIILNLILIPSYSYIGSGLATIITEIFLLTAYIILNAGNSLKPTFLKYFLSCVIASLGMALFLFQFPKLVLSIQILISILIYFSLLSLFKGFSKDDVFLLKKLFSKNED